jgi:hypothetical protein
MANMADPSFVGDLFAVNGMVALVTGGGTGKLNQISRALTQPIIHDPSRPLFALSFPGPMTQVVQHDDA